MNPFVISIPRWVEENHFPSLLALLDAGEGHAAIEVDIAAVTFLIPAAIVAILARCNRWKREGKAISLSGVEVCENLGYLQRIDFLLHLGLEIPERFVRRAASGRFVPVQTLNFASGDVDRIASEITRCTLPDANPEDDVYRILQYAAGELLSNERLKPRRNACRVASQGAPATTPFIPTQSANLMKLEFQMVAEFGEFLADGHLGNQFRSLRIESIWERVESVVFDFTGVT